MSRQKLKTFVEQERNGNNEGTTGTRVEEGSNRKRVVNPETNFSEKNSLRRILCLRFEMERVVMRSSVTGQDK